MPNSAKSNDKFKYIVGARSSLDGDELLGAAHLGGLLHQVVLEETADADWLLLARPQVLVLHRRRLVRHRLLLLLRHDAVPFLFGRASLLLIRWALVYTYSICKNTERRERANVSSSS